MTAVLIVDDVPAMAEQYAYDLKRLRGYETTVAKSGRTALESLTRDSVDCVILDLEMPGMDGFEVLRSIERLGLRVPVIVYTGTGDYDRCAEAIRLGARELHRLGANPKGPFVAINSAALPHELVESELFGHERGAFTGANATRKGAFESASGGTLFLDEIGDLPPAAQAKLLRVLEERKVTRLGGTKTIDVNTRVVAATHRDLDKEVSEGRFREDLIYRLNTHVLRVPPLRDRLSDVPALVEHLVALTCARFGLRPKAIAPDVMEALMTYDWRRNNIRELRNVVERMIIATDGEQLTRDVLPAEIRDSRTPHAARHTSSDARRSFEEQKQEAERQIVIQALERNEWHITKTAKELGLSDHASLLKIMRRLGVQRDTEPKA